MNKNIFKNKKILITGHTGFKGSWLTLWMLSLGAKVIGVSKNIPTKPSHYNLLNIQNKIKNYFFDIKNQSKLKLVIIKHKPDFIFHLAAQALVKKSYKETTETWNTNTIGTINLLESLRGFNKKCHVILVTSEKSYKNLEFTRGYHENDILGGADPYSASKAAAELAIQSYLKSFYSHPKNKIFISIARAGNVIGGGDWAEGRLIPDCMKRWSKNKTVILRNPKSTRPWQHVLDVLRGYLILAVNLKKRRSINGEIFNFGPKKEENSDVINIVKEMKTSWGKASWVIKKNKSFLESALLQLDSTKANKILGWKCLLNLRDSVYYTTKWYKTYYKKSENILNFSINQIKEYEGISKYKD